MWVSKTFICFVIFSFLGWIYESTYCTINERRWENRGFLYGPICPIYGVGVVTMMAIYQFCTAEGITLEWWQVFMVAFFGSAVLEYSTHWALEKLFHAYWWDYSNMPLNLNGRICLPASTLFGLGGLLVVYVLYQPTETVLSHIHPNPAELVSLVLGALIAADTAITVSALRRIANAASAINRRVNEHMDAFVSQAVEKGEAAAALVQEGRDGAAMVLSKAAETIQGAGAVVTGQRPHGEHMDQAATAERERFEAALRDRMLGGMGHSVRAAARRVKRLAPVERMGDVPGAKVLAGLMQDVTAKHWPRKHDERESQTGEPKHAA
jgi:uncharacterized membrane protein